MQSETGNVAFHGILAISCLQFSVVLPHDRSLISRAALPVFHWRAPWDYPLMGPLRPDGERSDAHHGSTARQPV